MVALAVIVAVPALFPVITILAPLLEVDEATVATEVLLLVQVIVLLSVDVAIKVMVPSTATLAVSLEIETPVPVSQEAFWHIDLIVLLTFPQIRQAYSGWSTKAFLFP